MHFSLSRLLHQILSRGGLRVINCLVYLHKAGFSFSFGRLWFTHLARHFQRRATLGQHLVDGVQKALPAIAIGQGEPLQHHKRVQVLGEKRVAHIVGEPLMEPARPVSVSILRALAFEFL